LVVAAYVRRRTNVLLSTLDVRQIRRCHGKRKASGMESNMIIIAGKGPNDQPSCQKPVRAVRPVVADGCETVSELASDPHYLGACWRYCTPGARRCATTRRCMSWWPAAAAPVT
jgi:hypothetical protein